MYANRVGVAFKSMFSRIMRSLRALAGLRDGTMLRFHRNGPDISIWFSYLARCPRSPGICGVAFRA